MDLTWVKEVKVIRDDEKEVNQHLEKGWRLISAHPAQEYLLECHTSVTHIHFIIGR